MSARVPTFEYRPRGGSVIFGPGCARTALPDALVSLGISRALVVMSKSQQERAGTLIDPIRNTIVSVFDGVVEHVPIEVAERARMVATEAQAEGIVSIGGGSATGTAKAIALTTGLPIVAIPTTYAGSEMTDVWGLTSQGIKQTGSHPDVLPRVVIYDPSLLSSLPPQLAIASGFNALAHCVEAFWGPGANPVTNLLAAEGVRVLARGIHGHASGGSGHEALANTESLMYGAFLAGTAFAVAGSGLHHKVCHVLGGAFNLPHADTHAVVLPNVLALNAPFAPEAEHAIAAALGSNDAVGGLQALAVEAGVPSNLADLGLTSSQIHQSIDLIAAKLPISNPAPLDPDAVARLMWAAYGRARPDDDGAAASGPDTQHTH